MMRRRISYGLLALVLLAAVLAMAFHAIPPSGTNFSQYPGFEAYLAANPPSDSEPTPSERRLLERFRPRFHLPEGHEGPIDFYADYVAQGTLSKAGVILAEQVTPAILNADRLDPHVVFRHVPPPTPSARPTVLARIDRAELVAGGARVPLLLLTYHAVFRSSGVLAGIPAWQDALLGLALDLDDWHQLDHYTAATVVLDANRRPVALMLQQHNYVHTYLVGEAVALPADGRLGVDVAVRSNELFPHGEGRRHHRAVRFLSEDAFRYMLGAGPRPFLAGTDITDPQRELDYDLAFLPPSDAFYTFRGFLGERRRLPGRDGPPGALYNTLPAYKPLGRQLVMGYWREGHEGDIARFEAAYSSGGMPDFIKAQAPVLVHNLACLSGGVPDCSLK